MTMTKKDRKAAMTSNLLKSFEAQFVYDTFNEPMQELISSMRSAYEKQLALLDFKELTLLHTSMTGSSTRFHFRGELIVKSFKNVDGEFYSELSHATYYSDAHPFKSMRNPLIFSKTLHNVRKGFFHKSFAHSREFIVSYHETIGLLLEAGYDVIELNTPLSV